MLSFLFSEAAVLVRVVQAVALFVLMTTFAPAALHGAESRPEPRILAVLRCFCNLYQLMHQAVGQKFLRLAAVRII